MTVPNDMPSVYTIRSVWDSSILFQDQTIQHAADILRYLGALTGLDPGFSQWNQYLPPDPLPDGPLPESLPDPYLGRPITAASTTDELNERLAAGLQAASTDYGYPLLLGIASDDPTLDVSLELRVGASIVGIQNYAALRFNTQESAAAHATPVAIITAMIAALNLGGLHASFLSSDFRDQQNWDLGSENVCCLPIRVSFGCRQVVFSAKMREDAVCCCRRQRRSASGRELLPPRWALGSWVVSCGALARRTSRVAVTNPSRGSAARIAFTALT